jgi:hypothetical protein
VSLVICCFRCATPRTTKYMKPFMLSRDTFNKTKETRHYPQIPGDGTPLFDHNITGKNIGCFSNACVRECVCGFHWLS